MNHVLVLVIVSEKELFKGFNIACSSAGCTFSSDMHTVLETGCDIIECFYENAFLL